MIDVYVYVIQPFEMMTFVATFYSPNMPAAQLQSSGHGPPSVAQGLRDNLYSAINDIKSLKDENIMLRMQISQLKHSQLKVFQLQEESKEEEDVLQMGLCGQSSGGADVMHWTNQPASGTLPEIITLHHSSELLDSKSLCWTGRISVFI